MPAALLLPAQWGHWLRVYQLLLPFFQPHIIGLERCAALRAAHGVNFGVGAPGVLLYIAAEDLKIPVVAGGRAQAGPQGFLLSGVGRKTGPQVEHPADIGGVQRVGKGIVELPLHGQP